MNLKQRCTELLQQAYVINVFSRGAATLHRYFAGEVEQAEVGPITKFAPRWPICIGMYRSNSSALAVVWRRNGCGRRAGEYRVMIPDAPFATSITGILDRVKRHSIAPDCLLRSLSSTVSQQNLAAFEIGLTLAAKSLYALRKVFRTTQTAIAMTFQLDANRQGRILSVVEQLFCRALCKR